MYRCIFTHPSRHLSLLGFHDVSRWRHHPLRHDHAHRGHIGRQGGAGIPQHREQCRLPTSLEANGHQLHAVVGDAVSELSPEVGKEVLGGATFGNAREKVVRNVLDLETVQVQLPTVTKTTKGQG